MDLLKNMVFRQVDRSKFKELNMNWKSITRSLEKIDEKPLRFLRYFIMANYDTSSEKDGILREDQIYTWLSNNNAQCHYEEAPFQFVQKMAQNVELYVKCRMPDDKSEGNVHLKNIPLLAGKSYKLHLMLLLAASNMNPDALASFKAILESVVYYTVIDKIATNVTERTFASWCKDIRNIVTIEDLDRFVKDTLIPTVNDWKLDNKDDPSNSIQHQQIMLMEYAKSRHFPNPTYFIDDGYSGVEFNNRPGFQRMLAEIEAGHVEVVITKDLSRLGRNSSLTGLYINYTFPQYGVRYIAINDHFDTIDPNSTDSDMAGIKNWFNDSLA